MTWDSNQFSLSPDSVCLEASVELSLKNLTTPCWIKMGGLERTAVPLALRNWSYFVQHGQSMTTHILPATAKAIQTVAWEKTECLLKPHVNIMWSTRAFQMSRTILQLQNERCKRTVGFDPERWAILLSRIRLSPRCCIQHCYFCPVVHRLCRIRVIMLSEFGSWRRGASN